jgi:MazG family protein
VAERSGDTAAAVARLDEITRRLRRECPWDREQDERSIVPHTVEEAYELADAAHAGDDAKLLDELGDVLFQVEFLSLLLEERGAGSLTEVADHCREKLIRRHPHVFGEVEARDAAAVLRNWGQIKREDERGGEVFGELPETLPATLYARKVQRRAESAGLATAPAAQEALARVASLAEALGRGESPAAGEDAAREQAFAAVGHLLLAAVEAAGALDVDPEIALRRAAEGHRAELEQGRGAR